MTLLPRSIENLIDEFSKLPGIGPKTAARLVFYLLKKPKSKVENFGQAMVDLLSNLKYCQSCFSITEVEICQICSDEKRDKEIIAVVEEPLDIVALEKTKSHSGIYHVLGGVISPIDGIGPEELRISPLLDKVRNFPTIREVIIATNPTLEGEATATYISNQIEKIRPELLITRLARGLPVGGDLEYADEVTLMRSFEGRKKYK